MAHTEDDARFSASCDGVTVLVTGASRGLGREIARTLAGAGASLVLVARDAGELERVQQDIMGRLSKGARVRCCAIDLASELSITVLQEYLDAVGMAPDVLINNAATQGPIGHFWENDWWEWMESFRLNAFAPLRLCRMVLPGMIARRRGKILTISGGGAAGPRPGFTAYASAKSLLVRFTETLAEEVRPFGIDVNAVAPGAMNSAMTDAVIRAGPLVAGKKEFDAAVARKAAKGNAALRAAQLCLFLSSHSSDGITGRLISAAWDPWETLTAHREEIARSDVYTLRRILPADRGMEWARS